LREKKNQQRTNTEDHIEKRFTKKRRQEAYIMKNVK